MYPANLLRKQVREEKRRQRLVIYTFLLFITLYLIWTFIFDDSGYLRYRALKEKRGSLLAEIVELQKDNVNINEEIRLLKEESFYVEKQARENLNLSRPDEYVFIFDK